MYSKVLKNTSFLAFIRLSQPIFSFILVVVIARNGGTELLGGFAIVLSYLAIFQTFATFGLKYLLTREVAKNLDETGKYFLHSSLLSVPIGIVCAFLMYGVVAILGYESSIKLSIGVAGFALVFTTVIENCEGIFIGLENIGPYAIVCFFENLLRITLSIAAIIAGYGLVGLIGIFSCTRLLALLANLLLLRKAFVSRALAVDLTFALNLLKSAKTFALIVILATIYSRADILILSKIKGTHDVGIYSAAFRFIAAAQLLLASFSNSLYPHLTRIYQQSAERFRVVSTDAIKRLLSLVVPAVVLGALLAEHVIGLVFGGEFEGSVRILQILVLSLFPFAFITVGDYVLLSSHNQRLDLRVNAYAVVCSVVLNSILIPVLGALGAAIAMLSSTLIYLAIQYHFLARCVFHINVHSIFAKPAVAATIMVAFFMITKDINVVLAAVFSLAMYVVCFLGLDRYLKKVLPVPKGGENENQ